MWDSPKASLTLTPNWNSASSLRFAPHSGLPHYHMPETNSDTNCNSPFHRLYKLSALELSLLTILKSVYMGKPRPPLAEIFHFGTLPQEHFKIVRGEGSKSNNFYKRWPGLLHMM
ncbi:hypothetical protein HAX54_049014 [Datura stramonium]|uniref:Uncharacterized protein n=1 Tax=Datura stramonium TaxID=4076 RepID=A0ABS8WM41_DATST|nr:hypothetical protein [Datura stramonium]